MAIHAPNNCSRQYEYRQNNSSVTKANSNYFVSYIFSRLCELVQMCQRIYICTKHHHNFILHKAD
mgnify:CR=1 FL=1